MAAMCPCGCDQRVDGVLRRAAAHTYEELRPLLDRARADVAVLDLDRSPDTVDLDPDLVFQLEAWLLAWVHGTQGPDAPDLTSLGRAVSFCRSEPAPNRVHA